MPDDDLKLREQLDDKAAAETPEDRARDVLSWLGSLAERHEQHFPGDPLSALLNLEMSARRHIAGIVALLDPPVPKSGPLAEAMDRLRQRLSRPL